MKLRILFCFLLTSQLTNAQTGSPVAVDSNKIFLSIVEIEASYPGGAQAWKQYLTKNLKTSVPIDEGAPQGIYKVFVKFKVDKEGVVTDVVPESNNGYGTEEEVVRVIKRSGNWKPAMQKGRNVNAYRRQPVTFLVEGDIEFTSKEAYTFYKGEDNELEIKVKKINDEDLDVTISNGIIIKKGDGKYIVKVQKAGKAIIEVINTKKKNKVVGTAKFDVL
jgi:hypothetical protein